MSSTDICAARDDAQPHIFEQGRCVMCLKPDPSRPVVWYVQARDHSYHVWEDGKVRPLTREAGRRIFN